MKSLWQTTAPRMLGDPFARFPRDVVVVGAGITGLTTAVLLARAGLSVTVLEARRIGAVTTGNTTGKLSLLQGTVFSELLEHTNEETLRAYAQANLEGQAWLIRELESWGIEVERRTAYTYAARPEQRDILERERKALAIAGIEVDDTDDVGLPFETHGALRLDHQAQLHPYLVLDRLLQELRSRGGSVVEHCRVHDVEVENGSVRVQAELGSIAAEWCVLATGTPILDRGLFFAKLEPSRSYVAAYHLDSPAPQGMYVSAGAPVRSLRTGLDRDRREVLVIGGPSIVTGRSPNTASELAALDEWAPQHFANPSRLCWWAAQDYRMHSRVPFAGPMPRGGGRIFAATGYHKWGMSNAIAAALTISADVLGGNLEWAKALRRHSPSLPEIGSTIATNTVVAGQLLADWVSAGAAHRDSSEPEPAEGEGVVVREGLAPVAVSRVDGSVCRLSGVCTHLGGILHWNSAERSWDCPLHGSRFSAQGEVLEGPAVRALAAAPERSDEANESPRH